ALRLAHPENLAPPEVLRSELRSFDKSAQLSPGKLGVNAAAKAAIRAGNYILATDHRGIAKMRSATNCGCSTRLVGWLTTPGISILPGGTLTTCQARHSCSCRTLPASKE